MSNQRELIYDSNLIIYTVKNELDFFLKVKSKKRIELVKDNYDIRFSIDYKEMYKKIDNYIDVLLSTNLDYARIKEGEIEYVRVSRDDFFEEETLSILYDYINSIDINHINAILEKRELEKTLKEF